MPESNCVVNIIVDAVPRGKLKDVGGGNHDQWNDRISRLVVNALPVDLKNAEAVSDAGSAVASGMVDMKPTDPTEGVLISQIVTANEAALEFTTGDGLTPAQDTSMRVRNIYNLLTSPRGQ